MYGLSHAEIQSLSQTAIELVAAAGLGAARALGIMLVLPVFTRPHITGLIRGYLATAIALPSVMQVSEGLSALDPATRLIRVVLLGSKEVFVGLLLGFLLSIPLWSIQSIGDLIDMQRGISSQGGSDDISTNGSQAMGLFLGLTAITIFVLSGGLQAMIAGLYGSYVIWPVFRLLPAPTAQAGLEFLHLLDHIMRTTLVVAGPVLALLLLIDVSVMMLGRLAAQIKLSDLSPLIKNVAFSIIMVGYAVYLIEYMGFEITQSSGVLDLFAKLLR